ncbi:hypothetical protein BurJ1DRAFT_0942 [Burkholderiales bacterium JOSHI_001]|nr:hypothetical protein BurJ1DRAFT_0942 [Burkholderiales bacterium JOSHI_001]
MATMGPHVAAFRCILHVGAAALALSVAGGARADTLVLNPVQDASIFTGTPTSDSLAEGSGDYLWLSTTAEGLARRALLRFDLGAVPPGSVLRSARLVLYESRSRTDHPVAVHRLLASWTEGPANAGGSGTGVAASNGDVTWRLRSHPTLPWQQPGGDHLPNASATTLVGLPNQTYAWADAPGLVADVQQWVNAPADNHGWILIGDETNAQSAKRFESRNNAVAVNRPRLELVFDPPAPPAEGDVPLPLWALALLAATLGWRLQTRP